MKRLLTVIFAALAVMAVAGCKKAATYKSSYVPATGISLNYSSETLAIGGELQLYATVEPSNATNKTVTWESSKNNVASVEGGLVKAVSVGDAEITASCGGVSATCNIHVIAENIHVTAISLSPEEDVIKVGGTTRFTVRFEPANATNHNVTWETSNSDIARIDDSGLITGVSRGTVTITARSVDGNKPATATVKVVQPFTNITITAPDESDYHFKDGKFKYVVGETFQLQAFGEPTDSDDEIEYRVYGWGNNNYRNYFDIDETGKVTAIGPYSNCKVSARSKADDSVEAIFTFNVLAAPENIKLVTRQEDSEVRVYTTSPNYARNTQYIGRGTTQKFRVLVEPSTAPQDVTISQGPSWSAASASLSNGILSVSVASNASVSTTSNEVKFTISLKASNGHTNDFTFKVCLYDPYKVKVGDLIAKDGKIYDGGARGKGLFEDSIRKDGDDNSILAWLGNNHTAEDPFWSTCAPSEGLKTAQGTVIHGIAIPTHTDRLYRTEEAAGEYYYGDDGNDNYILDSGNLPSSWLTTNERKDLLRSISDKHSAIFNTCVHVYTNNGRGSSWEIRPANFFVDYHTVFPGESGHSASDIPKDKYSFWGAFGYSYSGAATFAYYAKNEGSIAGKYMTTWLWPTIADIYSIFTGKEKPYYLQAFESELEYTIEEDRVEIFKHSASQAGISGANIQQYNCVWWVANESGRDSSSKHRITQAAVTTSVLKYNTNALHKGSDNAWKAYVLPIRYF